MEIRKLNYGASHQDVIDAINALIEVAGQQIDLDGEILKALEIIGKALGFEKEE